MMDSLGVAWRAIHADWRAMTNEILNIKEVAAPLRLAEKTVYSMAQKGELPAFKIRGQWRIRRADLDDWIAAQRRTPRRRK